MQGHLLLLCALSSQSMLNEFWVVAAALAHKSGSACLDWAKACREHMDESTLLK